MGTYKMNGAATALALDLRSYSPEQQAAVDTAERLATSNNKWERLLVASDSGIMIRLLRMETLKDLRQDRDPLVMAVMRNNETAIEILKGIDGSGKVKSIDGRRENTTGSFKTLVHRKKPI